MSEPQAFPDCIPPALGEALYKKGFRRPTPRYRVRCVWHKATGVIWWYRVQWRDPWGVWVTVYRASTWQEAMNWANEADKDWEA
ncbi:hypothetical protein SEA_YAKULT_69 [Gordonia phage Yakult]|nr:hypothetical protein SEA_YAKULT_69 [Gordonia phage Yakult]